MLLGATASLSTYADYSKHPRAEAVIKTLVEQHGLTADEVTAVLGQAATEQRILNSMKNAAEKTKTWTRYRNSFLSQIRIDQGAVFLEKHADTLRDAEQRYGVPPQVITAILGVETNYGGYTGKANVLNALATLAFEHPRRGKFFQSELVEYIVLCKERGWSASEQLGSYAGAMGMSQFMPSNYRRLAVDGDTDGVVNLHEPTDAIYSVANYLKHHGWRRDEPVAARAAVESDFDSAMIGKGLKPNHSVKTLETGGYHSQQSVDSDALAKIIRFNDADGDEFWFGFTNFYVISRYNPRSKYAMAVYLLSQEIMQAGSAS